MSNEQGGQTSEIKQQLLIISDNQIKEITENIVSNLTKTGYFGPELLSIIQGHINEGISEYSEAHSPEKSFEIIEEWGKMVKFYQEKIQHEYYLSMGDSDYNLGEIAKNLLIFYNSQHTSFRSALKLSFFEIMSMEVSLRDKYDYRLQEWIWRLMIENGAKMN